jgi:hypothetical protein
MPIGQYSVYCQLWEVSEVESGVKPWGYSLHFTLEDLQSFVKKHWTSMSEGIPQRYLRPAGNPYLCEVGPNRHLKIFESENGCLIEGLPPGPVKENN